MQQILITGNIGKDAEIKQFSGKDYTVFSVGVNEKKGQEKVTTWWNVYKYGSNDALRPYLLKGTQVLIQGGFSYKVDTKDGKTYVNMNVNCDRLELLSKPAETVQVVESAQAAQATPAETESLPF